MADAKVTCVTEKASGEWGRLSIGYDSPAGEMFLAALAVDELGEQVLYDQVNDATGYSLRVIARRLHDLATFLEKHQEQPMPKLKEVA